MRELPTLTALDTELFRAMLRIRRVEERIKAVYHLREMRSPPHLYMGHEAIAVGMCSALVKEDLVFPYYRCHGWYLAKGGDLNAMLAELHGRETGCSHGWGGSMHLIDLAAGVTGASAIVGGTIPHAAGAALTFQIRGQSNVAVASFGDGAVEEGIFHETLNFAALRKLPVVFVCENNLYATNTHIRDRQALPEISRHAERFGIPGFAADGNDVAVVRDHARAAVDRARKGEGPTLLEFRTYRILEHCGINEDHELGYRTQDEIASWQKNGPLEKGKRLVSESDVARIAAEIEREIDAAFAFAKGSPWPTSILPEEKQP